MGPVTPTPWDQIDARFADFAAAHPTFEHMSAIVRSVRSVGADGDLAAFTSMHDVTIASSGLSPRPYPFLAFMVERFDVDPNSCTGFANEVQSASLTRESAQPDPRRLQIECNEHARPDASARRPERPDR